FYDDIVLQAAEFFGISRNSGKKKLGFNIYNFEKSFFDKFLPILKLLRFEPVFISTHLKKYGIQYEFTNNDFKSISYEDPVKFLKQLSELDFIFSVKLHVGVSGAA